MTSVCGVCTRKLSRHDEKFTCSNVCKQTFHWKCVNMTADKHQVMLKQNEAWVCGYCGNGNEIVSLRREKELLEQLMEELKRVNELQREKIEYLEKKVANKGNIKQLSYTYSDVLREKESVLLVKPADYNQECKITKKNIKNKIDPTNMQIGIRTFKDAHKGAVVIGCDTKQERDLVENELKKVLGSKYEVTVPQNNNLKIKITGVDLKQIDEDDLIPTIMK